MKREPYSQRSNPGDPIYVRGRNARPPTRLATLVHSFNRHISTLSLSNFGRYHIPRSLFKLLFIFRCNIGQRKAQVRISAVELLVSMNSHLLPHGHLPFRIRHLPHRWSSYASKPYPPLPALGEKESRHPFHFIFGQCKLFRPTIFLRSGFQPIDPKNLSSG